jgi:hypothetical protein
MLPEKLDVIHTTGRFSIQSSMRHSLTEEASLIVMHALLPLCKPHQVLVEV